MTDELADRFMLLARSEPREALQRLDEFRRLDADSGGDSESALYRGAALAAWSLADVERSNDFVERAVVAAQSRSDDHALTAALLTKAGNLFLGGAGAAGLELALTLDGGADRELTAQIKYQIGTFHARSGQPGEAITALEEAVHYATESGSVYWEAAARKNRGMLRGQLGETDPAIEDLAEARRLFQSLGLELELAFCDHSLALVQTNAGNLPAAFSHFAGAERRIRTLTGDDSESKSSHCRALLAAGLVDEAATTARAAADTCAKNGLLLDSAEARILEATALLRNHRPDQAAQQAALAAEIFGTEHQPGLEAVAQLLIALADVQAGREIDLDRLTDAVERLRRAGRWRDALEATILLAENRREADPVGALRLLDDRAADFATGPADIRVAELSARTAILAANDRSGQAAAAAATGFETVAEYQASLGSADLRAGVHHYVRRICQVGLELAVTGNDTAATLQWMERRHVSAAVPEPALPGGDPEYRRALSRLRAIDADDHEGARSLEDEIRTLARSAATGKPNIAPVETERLTRALGETVGVSFDACAGTLLAAIVRGGGIEVVDLGAMTEIERTIRSVRMDLRRRIALDSHAVSQRVVEKLRLLDDQLLGSLHLDGAPAVIGGPAALFAVPWAGLPSRVGRLTSVTSSLSAWVNAGATPNGDGVTLIAGPGLPGAKVEISALSELYADAVCLIDPGASVDAIIQALDSSAVAHFACHGTLRPDNPLFSSLSASDGPFNVYELGRLGASPDLVILSACHLGLPASTPDRELLGLATSFLLAGTRCVVASTLPISDDRRSTRLMVSLHQRLLDGLSPASAWAEVQMAATDKTEILDTATFTVFGRG